MGLSRADARSLAKATLESTGLFDVVFCGAPDTFGGKRKTALITSSSIALSLVTRDMYEAINAITVSVYVPRTVGTAADVEDTLDALVLGAMEALVVVDAFIIGQSDAGTAGAPNRVIDGVVYRVERIPISIAKDN